MKSKSGYVMATINGRKMPIKSCMLITEAQYIKKCKDINRKEIELKKLLAG